MAQYADNDVYLDIDGTQVDAYFIDVQLEPTIASVETTAGSGTDHVTRAAGLKDHTISFTLTYDVTFVSTLLPLIKPGVHAVTYGPEDNTTGKPKHVQSFIFEGAPHQVQVDKQMVQYSVSGSAAAAPTTDMFNGGVWA